MQLAGPGLSSDVVQGRVVLTWTAVSESTGNYAIYKSIEGGAYFFLAGTNNSTLTYTDSNVRNGKEYTYYVTASNNAGPGQPSNSEEVPVALPAPGLSLRQAHSLVRLEWTAVPEATSYTIYRAVNDNTFFEAIGNTPNLWRDVFAFAGAHYRYYVVGVNAAGEGQKSAEVLDATCPAEPASTAGAPWQGACPKVGGPGGGSTCGPCGPDPVNVATGGESNEPGPDLVAYNPSGPQAAFQRMWRVNQAKRGYGSPGLPMGWVHTYDVALQATGTASWTAGFRFGYANGANEGLTPQVDANGQPTGEFTTDAGVPYYAQGVPGASAGQWQSITLTWKDRSRWEFRPYGSGRVYALARIYDRMGRGLSFNYTAATRCLTSIQNTQTGQTLLSFTYGTNNFLLTALADAYGRKVVYGLTGLAGSGAHLLESVSQVVTSGTTNPPARYTYGYHVRQAGTANPPFLTTTTVPSPTGTGSATSVIAYDAQNRVSVITDATARTRTFVYQSGGTVIEDRDAAGNLAHSYRLNFDAERRNTGTTLSGGETTLVEYTDAGNARRPTRVTTPDNKTVLSTYDPHGNLLTTTTPRGVTTTYTWDYAVFRLGRLLSVQEAGKPATTFTYYEPSGLVQSVTSPSPSGSGTVTHTLTYDALGNVLMVTGPGNNAAATVTTTFNYTQDGAYSQPAALGQPLTVTDPQGKVSHFRYDLQGRPVSGWDALGNTVGVQYNVAGQPTVLTLPATGQSGAGNGATETVYLYPGGPAVSAKVYNENATLVRQVDTAYDAEGRPLQVTGSTEPVRFEYDGAGRQWRRYDGNNNLQSEYLYHPQGWLAQERKPQPGGGWHERSYGYDASGRVTGRTDGVAGQAPQIGVTYVYDDPDGLLTEVRYLNAPARNVLLGYDGYGRLTSRTDGTGVQTYSYGDLDQLLTATTTYTGLPAQALSYTYYADGSRSGMSTPAGQFGYLYDQAGQATSLTNPFGETTGWSYRDNGWLQTQTLGNGVTSSYVQNALGQLTSLLNQTGGGALLSQFSGMVHDGAGNRLSVTANVPGAPDLTGNIGYQYDTKDQLTQETSALAGGFTSAFGYDPAGNPTLFKGATRSYDAQNRRSDTGFVYDVQGNPTTYKGVGISYTPEGQATAIGGLLTADYTAEGVRAWKQGATGRTYFLYDGLVPVAELNAAGAVTAVNTFGANGLVSRRTTAGGGTSVFYVFDERGNTSRRLDAAGNVLSSHAADAFGGVLSMPAGAAADDPYAGYGGQWGYYRDSETGLYLCTFRYYDPAEGRWLTPDPIGYAGGVNLYGYVGNRATSAVDPLGEDALILWGGNKANPPFFQNIAEAEARAYRSEDPYGFFGGKAHVFPVRSIVLPENWTGH